MNKLSGALRQSKAVSALLQHQQVRPGQQLCGGSGLLLGRPKCNAVRQMLDGLGHVEGFHEPLVQRFFRAGGLVTLSPVVQQVEIIGQHPQAVGDVCPLLVRQATLGRQGDGIGRRLIRVKPEVVYQLLGGLPGVQVEQLGGEVDGISVGSTAKAVIIGVVQLHAGVAVGMERTAHHAMAVGLHAVHLSHLPNGDGGLDSLIQAQGHFSFVSCVAPEYPQSGNSGVFCFLPEYTENFAGKAKKRQNCNGKRKKPLLVADLQQQGQRGNRILNKTAERIIMRKNAKRRADHVAQEYLPAPSNVRLADLMKEHNISQPELAKEIGCSKSTISRFISGAKGTLTHEQVLRIARLFNVSTDFLLGETNIPDRKNYDIAELGLSVEAAKNLYTGRVNTEVVNLLLENARFAELTYRISQYFDDTFASGIAAQNAMLTTLSTLLRTKVKTPEAAKAAKDISLRRKPVYQGDLDDIEMYFMAAVKEIKKGIGSHYAEQEAMSKKVAEKMFTELTKGQDVQHPTITAEQLTDAMLDSVSGMEGATPEALEQLRSGLLGILQSAAEQENAHEADE